MKEFVVNLKNPEDSPEKIASKLNTLHSSVEPTVIRGGVVSMMQFEEHTKRISKIIETKEDRVNYNNSQGRNKLSDLRYHGAGLSKVTTNTTLTGDGTIGNPLGVVSGGSGFQLPLTGAVNGSNQVYTWKTAPKAIVIDGSVYQATQQDGTVNWTGTTTTIFSLLAPNSSIFSVA